MGIRRLLLPLIVAFTIGAGTPASADSPDLPATYLVSEDPGVLPEGIGLAADGTIYVTSLGTGDVYRGHVTEEAMTLFAAGAEAGRSTAAGVHTDARGRVFVLGGAALDVYDPAGRLLAHRSVGLQNGREPFLNDFAITSDAVYVTDSATATVWRAPLRGDDIGALSPWLDARDLYPGFPTEYFFLNGIAATPDGHTVLVSSQGLGALIRVDTATADARFVEVDGETFDVFGPDGMVLRGDLLYGVLNYGAPAGQGVYVARLDDALASAEIVTSVVDPAFDTPTTMALRHGRMLVVNSQLDHAPGEPPYTVTAVDDPM